MGLVSSLFKRKDPRTPVQGVGARIKNIITVHYRGIFGVLVPLVLLAWQPRKGRNDITVRCLWIWMTWFFFIQPVNIPVVGLIPMFLLPMTGVLNTIEVTKCYFNEHISLHVLGGMIHLLMNGCGVDRRIILWLLCSGDNCQFSGKRIVFKASTAAFFMSMFSNRLIVCSTIIQFLTPAYVSLQTSTAGYRKTEPDYQKMGHIVLNAVQTASAIGSVAMVHASLTVLTMRSIWSTHPGTNKEYPDIFNYLQYICFAFPVAFLMFILNFLYHMYLINSQVGKPMSANSMTEMKNLLLNHKRALPPGSMYEKICILFYLLYVLICMFRWSDWLGEKAWSSFRTVVPNVPVIKDATVAAIFVIILHILPRSLSFLKYMNTDKKSELGTLKPESAIMWWKFVDKNTIYGYILLMGSGVVLNTAIRRSTLDTLVTSKYGQFLTKMSWNVSILFVVIISVIIPNIISGVAACCVFLPFVLNMAAEGVKDPWPKNLYLGALAVGIGTSMGFMCPFLFTPAYFCHFTGKVPIKKMVKLSIGSLIICALILWLSLILWAPFIWDPNNVGIFSIDTGTGAPPGGGGGGGEPPPPAPEPEAPPEG